MHSWIAAGIIFIISQVVTIFIANELRDRVDREARTRFESYTTQIEKGIDVRLNAHLEILHGLRGLFDVIGMPTRKQFHDYASNYREEIEAFGAINFAQLVRKDPDEIKAFEDSINNDQSIPLEKNVKIFGESHTYPFHLLIRNVEPQKVVYYGKDIGSIGLIPGLIDAMVDAGTIMGSGQPFPEIDQNKGVGLGFRLPLYKGGGVPQVSDRKNLFYGSVGISLFPRKLIQEFISAEDFRFLSFKMESLPFSDKKIAAVKAVTIFASAVVLPESSQRYERTARIEVGHRPFILNFSAPADHFKDMVSRHVGKIAHILGLLVGSLTAALSLVFFNSKRRLKFQLEQKSNELRRASAQLTHLLADKILAQETIAAKTEEERKRLGKDLHDNLGQKLTGASLLMESMMRQLPDSSHLGLATQISQIVEECIGAVRTIAHGMSPLETENINLEQALTTLGSIYQSILPGGCEVILAFDTELLSKEEELHLYRISQEAITNAIRHGKASRVSLHLNDVNGRPLLAVMDNGTGIDDFHTEGLGVKSMRSRAHLLGMTLSIYRNLAGGTTVEISG